MNIKKEKLKNNSIFNKLFNSGEENLSIGIIWKSIVFFMSPEQMSTAFLLAESRDQIPVDRVKITEMFPDHCGRSMFINMGKSDIRISENPEPVLLPASFVNMNAGYFRQRCFKNLRGSPFRKHFLSNPTVEPGTTLKPQNQRKGN